MTKDNIILDKIDHEEERKKSVNLRRKNWLEKQGDLFLENFKPSYKIGDIIVIFNNNNINQDPNFIYDPENKIKIAGRIIFYRQLGKINFIKIKDINSIGQICLSEEILGILEFSFLRDNLSMGDIIGVEGFLFKTKAGEVTIQAKKIVLIVKSEEITTKWRTLSNQEIILKRPYLDIITNDQKAFLVKKRFEIIKSLKKTLEENEFLEVETPILQPIASGAAATPFKTHYNALERDFFLRIAPENYLKQMIVAGFEKVYEIGKCFRNEGIDRSHLQEFTMLECYSAYWNFEDQIILGEKMISNAARLLYPDLRVKINNQEVDFSTPWKRVTFSEIFFSKTGLNIDNISESDLDNYIKKEKLGEESKKLNNKFNKIDLIYKKKCCIHQVEPLIVTHYPSFYAPLAKPTKDGNFALMFQLIIGGIELIKAYSELADHILLEKNFNMQESENQDKENAEYVRSDKQLVDALSMGMPYTAGLGIGVDRLAMILLCGFGATNIRDSLMFTHYRYD